MKQGGRNIILVCDFIYSLVTLQINSFTCNTHILYVRRNQIISIHTSKIQQNNRMTEEAMQRLPELAAMTKNYTGAELEGLIRSTVSFGKLDVRFDYLENFQSYNQTQHSYIFQSHKFQLYTDT